MSWFSRAPNEWEQAWRAGRWGAELCDCAWIQADRDPSIRNVYLAFKVQHAVAGLQQHNLDYVEDFVNALDKPWQALTIRLLCARLQHKQREAATSILERHLTGPIFPRRAAYLAGFPLALEFVQTQQPGRLRAPLHQLATNARKLLGTTRQLNRPFLQSLANRNCQRFSVAVVGNSPSLLNRSDGSQIDQHDIVVRFNAASLAERYHQHTGTRTDLWVVSPGLAGTQRTMPTKAMALSGINPLAGQSRFWRSIAKRGIPQLAQFDQRFWYQLVKQLQAPPSAGLLTLRGLASQHKHLEVNAFGFSTPDDLRKRPAAGEHYCDNRTGSTRHNWQKEAILLSDEFPARNC